MTPENTLCDKICRTDYATLKKKAFRLTVKSGMDLSWIDAVLSSLGKFPVSPSSLSRRSCFLKMPEGFDYPVLFVKVYAHTDERHESFRRKNFFRRLMPRYAAKEGRAYLGFGKMGFDVPGVVLFGEEWHFGIRNRGIVIVEAVQGKSYQKVMGETDDPQYIKKIFKVVADIHAAGFSHGDAHLVNFIRYNDRIVTVDLENSKPLTPRGQKIDLINVMVSLLVALPDIRKIKEGLDYYFSFKTFSAVSPDALLKEAKRKAEKVKSSEMRSNRFNPEPPPLILLNDLL